MYLFRAKGKQDFSLRSERYNSEYTHRIELHTYRMYFSNYFTK